VNLLSLPKTVITDAELANALGRVVQISAVVDYLGELGALVRTAKAGQRWIAAHSDESGAPGGSTRKHRVGKDRR
jgi:hypothetical protein